MEDLSSLKMKEQMLLIELDAIKRKISLFTTMTTVTDVPESESLKTKAIPEQTAPGKETSNPLRADALLKSITKDNTLPDPMLGKTSKLVNSSPLIEGINKMTTLSPNNLNVQELVPDYLKALQKKPERFYVIYKGPHVGIHTDWGVVETFCKTDKVTCKKFRNEASARLSLATFTSESSSTKKVLLRPKIQSAKEDHRDQRFVIPREIEYAVSNPPLEIEDFRTLWNKARAACQEDFVHERCYTTEKKSKSLFNFIEGADPKLVHQAFQAGLIHNIYPSCNLQELKFFPHSMIDAIKNFRRKVLKAKDDPIYINMCSSILDWQESVCFAPYHFIEIGLSKSKKEIESSQPMEDKDLPFDERLHPVRINGLRRITEKIIDILSGSKKKANFADSHCLVTSWSFKNTSDEDLKLVSTFGEQFMRNSLKISSRTRQTFCRHSDQLFEDHCCNHCEGNNESKEGPSTMDDK